MTAKNIPDGYTVFDKKLPGHTVRVAFDVSQVRHDLSANGYILCEDQTSPVYRVMVKSKTHGYESGGVDAIPGLPDHVKDAVITKVEERLGIGAQQKKRQLLFEFASAHKRLLVEGRVSSEIANYRLTICTGTTKDGTVVSDKCPNYVNENGHRGSGHCKGCGCPEWEIAEMDRSGFLDKIAPGKAWYPMGCPKGRFTAMPGRRARATS